MGWLRGRCYGQPDMPCRWTLTAIAAGLLLTVTTLVPWMPPLH
jgi:hypothetical protein